MNEELKNQRKALADRVNSLYSPDDYPGSKAWRACREAEKALEAFDVVNPDIIAQIKTDKAAADKAASEEAGWI